MVSIWGWNFVGHFPTAEFRSSKKIVSFEEQINSNTFSRQTECTVFIIVVTFYFATVLKIREYQSDFTQF